MKRQRGRGRRPGGGGHGNYGGGGGGGGGGGHQNPNRTLESNGPETKVRGPAAVIFERYLQLARDAASSGDRVLSENYLQHADHYFRMVRAMQPAQPPPQQQNDRYENEMDGDEEGAPETEADGGDEGEAFAEGGEQPRTDFQQGQQQQQQQFDRGGEGEFRRSRGRRNRYRGDGDREGAPQGGEPREGGEQRPEGGERQRAEAPRPEGERTEGRRERRPPRERPDDQSGPEGFSSGPKPAFLRGGTD